MSSSAQSTDARPNTPNGTPIPGDLLETSPNSLRDMVMKLGRERDQAVTRGDRSQVEAIGHRNQVNLLREEIIAMSSEAGARNARRAILRQRGEDVEADEEEGAEAAVNQLVTSMSTMIQTVAQNVVAQNAAGGVAASTHTPALDRFVTTTGFSTSQVHDESAQELRALWNCARHIPLQAFTTSNAGKLARHTFHKTMTVTVDAGKKTVLDVSAFGNEEQISLADFFDGWRGYLEFVKPRCDTIVWNSLSRYFRLLTENPLFENSFAAILKFDIEQRSRWIIKGGQLKESVMTELPGFIALESAERIQSLQHELETIKKQGVRYAPYSVPSTASGGQPFRSAHNDGQQTQGGESRNGSRQASGGRDASSNRATRKPTVCLRCGDEGHHANACVSGTTRLGTLVTSAWNESARALFDRNNVKLCLMFNLSRCSNPDPSHGAHTCSLCGLGHAAHTHPR